MTEKLDITVPSTSKPKATKANPLVDVIPNQSFKVVFGDRWYYFTQGEKVKVPEEIKHYLKLQGALEVL